MIAPRIGHGYAPHGRTAASSAVKPVLVGSASAYIESASMPSDRLQCGLPSFGLMMAVCLFCTYACWTDEIHDAHGHTTHRPSSGEPRAGSTSPRNITDSVA